jgi:hypothetical protein
MAAVLARAALWLLAAFPAWLLFGLVGGLAPLGHFLLTSLVLALVDIALGRPRPWLAPLLAALLPLAPALAAWERPGLGWLAALAVGAGLLGLAADRLGRAMPAIAARPLGLLSTAIALLLHLALAPKAFLPRSHGPFVPLARPISRTGTYGDGAALVPGEEQVALERGRSAVRPAASWRAGAVALFFHGANADGSHQSTALSRAGRCFGRANAVLAVVHPASAGRRCRPWTTSPPGTRCRRAGGLDRLRATPGCGAVLAIGHSMGTETRCAPPGPRQRRLSRRHRHGRHGAGEPSTRPTTTSTGCTACVPSGPFEDAIATATIAAIWAAYYDHEALARAVLDGAPPIHLVYSASSFRMCGGGAGVCGQCCRRGRAA